LNNKEGGGQKDAVTGKLWLVIIPARSELYLGMKIVCGTDFSQHAAEAADVAAALAARLNETLALIHVMEVTRYELLSQELFEDLRDRRQARLKKEADRLRKAGGRVEEKLLQGSPSTALADFAAGSKARMIVVSSLGQIAPSRWLVGSVAERVAQTASVPTLVVRGAEAFKSWSKVLPLNILVGYDFSASSDAALQWVAALRKIGPCRITVAFLSWPPQERGRLGMGTQASPVENPPEVQKLLERDLRKRCQAALGDAEVHIRVAVAWGRPEPQLIELAREGRADLIVVGAHQRHGLERFWSVSREILHDAPMSVACVPASRAADAGSERIPTIERVLVATDFSSLGNRAIPFAYSTLERGGVACLLHVLEPTRSARKARDANIRQIEKQLRALIPSEAEVRRIVTQVEVVEGDKPATAICQAAERFGADLICISSHGRTGLSRAILGSVAQDVMARSHRPVLVVRPPPP
jgi:nucleotide-binding universal stress UspA family protein